MSRREDRGYKIVYKTKPRESEYAPPPRRISSRDADFEDEGRSDASDGRTRGSRTNYSNVRPRDSDRDYVPRRVYSDMATYSRENGIIVIETPRRRSPTRYAVEPRSEPRRRQQQNDYDEPPPLAKSRTMPVYTPNHRRSGGSVTDSRASRYESDDSDDDRRPRGRRDRQRVDNSPPRRLRSCLRGSRAESPDTGRERARSVSFREREASKHDVGNQMHERPGEEARSIGRFLRHDDDDDLASETYADRRRERRYS